MAEARGRRKTTGPAGKSSRSEGRTSRRSERDAAERFDQERGVFMISVAAELAGMHPQTLRLYEARGLIKPSRSPKQTRLYSQHDVEQLRRIQELTTEFGLNLAGVEQVLALERTMESLHEQLEQLKRESANIERDLLDQIEAVHRSYKRELVRWEPPGEILKLKDAKAFKIPIERSTPDGSPSDAGGRRARPKPGGGHRAAG